MSTFVYTVEGRNPIEASGDELCAANSRDENLVAWIDLAVVGDEIVFGGGAAPIVVIQRVA